MTTHTFNTESKGIQKLQVELIDFVHSMGMSVQEFAYGHENQFCVNGKFIQFETSFNGFDFCDDYSVVSLIKSITYFN
jgi:hypothetical protein